jgi:hypothetical protein
VIAYRLFGWPVWAAITFALAGPMLIDLAWFVSLNPTGGL